MKKETWICLLSFLSGVLLTNLLGSAAENANDILNRYTLATLTFQEIVYAEYFLFILYLRMQTVLGLWILSKLLREKFVKIGVLIGISVLSGAMVTMSMLENGIWGMWFFIMSMFPHVFFYGFAYRLWYGMPFSYNYNVEDERRKKRLLVVLILALITIGCACEAYVNPVLLESIVKF